LTPARPLGYEPATAVRGLYAIVDTQTLESRRLDPIAFAEAVLAAAPAALQLRAKDLPPRDTLALLRALAPMARRSGVPLVANDRADLAVLAGCDMVHVGQSDIAIERVRRIAPGLGVGVSTHSLEQLDAALAARPAYVAFGPVFPTSSKADAQPVVGPALLASASARARLARVPLVAVGGITLERARELAGSVDAVAVIGALLAGGDEPAQVTASAKALVAALGPTAPG
jgi:thiamine-phosphate pyrophosphorylase